MLNVLRRRPAPAFPFGVMLQLMLVATALVEPRSAHAQARDWPDPTANEVIPYETAGLTHGPVLGRAGATSMRLWVLTARPTAFEVLYDTRLRLTAESSTVKGQTTAQRDQTGVVDLQRLRPDTRYYYAVKIGGELADLRIDADDPWPSFRTLPDATSFADEQNPKGLFNLTFSIGSCASQDPQRSGGQYASPQAFRTLLNHHGDEVMFHVMNGDTIYEEDRDGTIEGLRANYRLYWSRGRSFANLMRRVPMLFTYDDHEIGWDIHGCGEVGLGGGKHLWRDVGLKAWDEYGGWANHDSPARGRLRFGTANVTKGGDVLLDMNADFSELDPRTVSTIHIGPWTHSGKAPADSAKNAGVYELVKVLDKHRLQVRPAFKADEKPSYSIGTHHWYDWRAGNCHFFALDTRGERSRPNFKDYSDDTRFILGAAQRKWLLEGVKQSDADFIFIISPDPWVIYHTSHHVGGDTKPKGDGFASFVHEREVLLKALDDLGKPVLIFTGDVHNSIAAQISDNVWEFLCGPMGSTAHPIGTAGNMPYGGWWDSQGRKVKIKWVAGFPNNVKYERLRNTYYTVVQVNNIAKSAKPSGPGHQWTAYTAPQVIVRYHDGYTGKLVYAESISPLDVED